MTRASPTIGIVTLLVCGAACGGGSGSTANGPPASGKTIVSLTDTEKGAFCANLAAIEGGYSKPHELACDGATGTVTFSIGMDQASCKTIFAALPASCASLTVGQLTACVTDTYAATCDTANQEVPSCTPFFNCLLGP
jgi:hypothetical protein